MPETPPEHINEMDWRIQNLTWTLKPFKDPATGAVIPAGASMAPVALIHHEKENLSAVIPNATALFLNLSHTFHAKARTLLKKCISDKDRFGKLPDDEALILQTDDLPAPSTRNK
jgi:hypothetical protein